MTTPTTKTDRARELLDSLKTRADHFAAHDEAWTAYLQHAARFWHYSANNQWLIWSQRPTASDVAGYTTWQRVGRQVSKGERGIWILAPRPYVREREDETGETTLERRISFRAVAVFAFEQTEPREGYTGTPYSPYTYPRLIGDAPRHLFDRFAAWLERIGHPVRLEDCIPNGYFALDSGCIAIADRGDPIARFGTLIHEAAHALHYDADPKDLEQRGKAYREIVAEASAYVAAEAIGIDTSRHAVPYIGAMVSQDPAAFTAALDMIGKVSKQLIAALIAAADPDADDVPALAAD